MTIKPIDYVLELSYDELFDLAICLRGELEYRIANTWVRNQKDWLLKEEKRLKRLKHLFESLNRPNCYEQVLNYAKNLFEEFNKQNHNDTNN